MKLYSQRDPAYDRLKLGQSNLTVHGYGCFLASIATLYQKSPVELLRVPDAFKNDGNLVSGILAKYCGGEAKPAQENPPKGWAIAVTSHFKDVGYPTHFFVANWELNRMMNPLNFPAKLEPIGFHIIGWRPFTNIKFDPDLLPPEPAFPDVPNDRWSAEAVRRSKELGFMTGYPDGLFKPEQGVTREELAVVITRLYDAVK